MSDKVYKIHFTPKQDITAYELAMCMSSGLMGSTPMTMDEFLEFDHSFRRHFTTEYFDKEAWKAKLRKAMEKLDLDD